MAKKIWQAFIQNTNGDIIPGALISVNVSGGGAATLWSDAAGTIAKANPFLASSQGFGFFFADEGEYDITASSGAFNVTEYNVEVGAPSKVSFLGSFSTLAQLEAAYPAAVTGSLAHVDADSNSDALLYMFDADQGWVPVAVDSGLQYFTESRNTSAPNATVPAHRLIASGAETNIDFVASAKGTGAHLAQIPDNTAAGGNKRGAGAVDWQKTRSAADRVASGDNSTISGGQENKSSGNDSTIGGGQLNFATALGSTIAGGYGGLADGSYSFISGGASAGARSLYGAGAHASGEGIDATSDGKCQEIVMILRQRTDDATPMVMSASGDTTPAAGRIYCLDTKMAATLSLKVVGFDGTDTACFWIDVGLSRTGSVATTALIGSATIADQKSAGAVAWDCTVSANTTIGGLDVNVTGEAGKTVKWNCVLEASELQKNT